MLVRPGPDPASLARDLRDLLQDRLGVPVDQRIISIAQLAPTADEQAEGAVAQATIPPVESGGVHASFQPGTPDEPAMTGDTSFHGRVVFSSIEATVTGGRVEVGIQLDWRDSQVRGSSDAVNTKNGRARAAAVATLSAAREAVAGNGLEIELDFASVVQALDGDYTLISVLAISPRTGRRPLPLVGAHPVETDIETASAIATLKAINRILSPALKSG